MVAACCLILGINIFEEGYRVTPKNSFFAKSKLNKGLFILNTNIWNNKNVYKMTGYSMKDIKDCLYMLSMFISK